MTTQQDAFVALKKETTYNTPSTPDTPYEFLDEDFDWVPEFAQGMGMRVGKVLPRANRRVLVKE
jgi:hypothetical protein